jgi:PPM family protein phosphatase
MRYFGITDPGKVRDHNEDAWNHVRLKTGYDLFIVSDGVAGNMAGDIAARIVVETLPLLLESRVSFETDFKKLRMNLNQILADLCDIAAQQAAAHPEFYGMAATVVCGLINDKILVLGNMGDSRCYLMRGKKMRQLTKDHTIVQMLLDLDEITPEQAADHPAAGKLTQAVGMAQEPLPHIIARDLRWGDRLLFSTDGLHGMIDDAAIAAILSKELDPEPICAILVRAALKSGGKDNITAVVVDITAPEGETE